MNLTDCQTEVREVTEKLRSLLDSVPTDGSSLSAESRRALEAKICLATRSAYFDFYTWVVLNGAIDVPAEHDLDELFVRSLKLMHDGEFKTSVELRYKDFKSECESVRASSANAGSAFHI